MISATSSIVDVAFSVCTALENLDVRAVLTGGSGAAYYTNKYRSLDVDFVLVFVPDSADARGAIERIGFYARGSHYAHPDTVYTLDFPPGPLGIGDEIINSWETVKRGSEILHAISRTDSVRDRLSAYYHWSDLGSLRTALLVAETGPIDVDIVRDWSIREGSESKFKIFEAALKDSSKRNRL